MKNKLVKKIMGFVALLQILPIILCVVQIMEGTNNFMFAYLAGLFVGVVFIGLFYLVLFALWCFGI